MKKIKLITAIVGINALGVGGIITITSCKTNTNPDTRTLKLSYIPAVNQLVGTGHAYFTLTDNLNAPITEATGIATVDPIPTSGLFNIIHASENTYRLDWNASVPANTYNVHIAMEYGKLKGSSNVQITLSDVPASKIFNISSNQSDFNKYFQGTYPNITGLKKMSGTGETYLGSDVITAQANKIVFASTYKSIGEEAFAYCDFLNDNANQIDIEFDGNDISFEVGAFRNCSGISSISFGGSSNRNIQKIDSSAFVNCESLKGFSTSGVTVHEIFNDAFMSCESLTYDGINNIDHIEGEDKVTNNTIGIYFEISNKQDTIKRAGNLACGDIICPQNANYGFGECASIKSISSIPGGEIPESAFRSCWSLQTTSWESTATVTAINIQAYRDCRSIQRINLVNSTITGINSGGNFYDCPLSGIVTGNGAQAFADLINKDIDQTAGLKVASWHVA